MKSFGDFIVGDAFGDLDHLKFFSLLGLGSFFGLLGGRFPNMPDFTRHDGVMKADQFSAVIILAFWSDHG